MKLPSSLVFAVLLPMSIARSIIPQDLQSAANETTLAEVNARDTGDNDLEKRDSSNCQGSFQCPVNPVTNPLWWVQQNDCYNAINRFDDNTWYRQWTARVSGHCTAFYYCDKKEDYGNGWPGSTLKTKYIHPLTPATARD